MTLSANVSAGELATGLQVAHLNPSGHALVAPAVLSVSGNWVASTSGSVFSANGGTVVFDGRGTTQQLGRGGSPFYNLTIAAGGSVAQLDDLVVSRTLVDKGVLNQNGHKLNGH